MKFLYQNQEYDVIIMKKRTTKNTYIRVNKEKQVVVTANIHTSDKSIINLIVENEEKIGKMIKIQDIKQENNKGFLYLGKKYIPIYLDQKNISFVEDKVYLPHNFDIEKWYKKEAKKVFGERLEYLYQNFSRKIPYPSLKIRKMTTRWGVCNVSRKTITLNLELIKRDTKYLDYVIIHELSHLIYGDHSKGFWSLVEENMKDYKKYRKEMQVF